MHTIETSPTETIDLDCATLVGSYYESLYRFALSLAKSSSDACDLTQETFLIWSTKGHELRDKTKAKTWLFTTLYREFLRGRRRKQRLVALEDLAPDEQDVPDVSPDLVTKMDAQLVLETLQEIDAVYREPLTLFYLRDLSYLEIADVLALPLGTVMSRLSRGKIQLRTLFFMKNKSADSETDSRNVQGLN